MERLVTVTAFQDGKTQIQIIRKPKTLNHYKIILRECGAPKLFFDHICSESLFNSKSYCETNKKGFGYVHIHLSKDDDNAKYIVVLDDSEWVKKHIKDIIGQLRQQEEQILINRAIKGQVKNINWAIRNDNFTPLIKQMIIENADTFRDEDIEQIKQTLDAVKQGIDATKLGL